MESATAFSPDGSEVIQRALDVGGYQNVSVEKLHSIYEIDKCVKFIEDNTYRRVALQFPDELLGHSTAIIKALEEKTEAKIFVLADTSYGSCCVDEIASQHTKADCIIHFGSSCLSPTSRLPVLYVFGQQCVDVAHCHSELTKLFPCPSEELVIVMYDVVYTHAVDELERLLRQSHPSFIVSKINNTCDKKSSNSSVSTHQDIHDSDSSSMPQEPQEDSKLCETQQELKETTRSSTTLCQFGRNIPLPENHSIDNYSIFYIGSEGRTLTNFMMTFNKCPFYTYNPLNQVCRKETLNVNRVLMKRYYLVEKAKDAGVVGIVAGTLGVKDYLTVIAHLKEIIKQAGKKSYTFVVGKLNVPKLANFMEIDVFVLVSCPENSLLDSQEFYKPVLTPYEMELACNKAREWTGDYVTDFREIIPGASKHVPLPADAASLKADVSLITGNLRTMGTIEDMELKADSMAVVARDNMTVATSHADAGEFFASRSWQGLQQDLGKTPVTKAVEGRKGIAASYGHETDDGTPV